MTTKRFKVPMRWGDMDAQGHVNNALLLDYLQEARAEFLLTGPNEHLLGGGTVVVSHQVEYLRPLTFSIEPVLVDVSLVELGASRYAVAYLAHHDGALCVRARTTLCPFDFEEQRPRRLSPEERENFAGLKALADAGALPPFRELKAPRLNGRGHRHELSVRWSDLDSYGHVNNVCTFAYVQEARIDMTTQADPAMARLAMPDAGGSLWMVARQDVDYIAQMSYRLEPYIALTAPVAIGRTSATVACEIIDQLAGDQLIARARTVLVRADATGRPLPLSDRTREVFGALLLPAD